jgi:predicted membrane protein
VRHPHNMPFSIKGNSVVDDIKVLGSTRSGLFPKLEYTSDGFDQAPKRLKMYASQVFGDSLVT